MHRSALRRFAWAAFLSIGCSGRTVGFSESPSPACGDGCQDAGAVCVEGQKKNKDCNTCTCSGGKWVCTESLCIQPECREGETMGKGCNACTCEGGKWACTLILCKECNDGQRRPADDGCNTCYCRDGGWQCTDKNCTGTACYNGQLTTAGDGCNTCSCSGGHWSCTVQPCPQPPDGCTEGETKPEEDGCNTCACTEGAWICTNAPCPSPTPKGCGGWLGDPCAKEEYCAYIEGLLCGAADASAQCRKKPPICPGAGSPVCACNGMTYANACLAAQAGTGVNTSGPCIIH